jgi:hypothetical protein
VKNQRGVVYLEMLIGFLPVFMFFLGTLQVADMSAAHLVVEHAATTAARAAVVVLPDDGAYYEDEDNALVDQFKDYRQSDVERAADTILAANPRLDATAVNVALDKPAYQEREVLTANLTVPYRCLVAVFCPGGLTITSSAQLIYQGAKYIYEPSTGWASSAANKGLDNIKNKVAENKNKEEEPGDGDDEKPDDGNDTDDKQQDDGEKQDDNEKQGDDEKTGDDKPDDQQGKDNADEQKPKPDTDDDPTNDAANQKKVDDLKKGLPPKLRDVPIKIDPDLKGSEVRVEYTHDDEGRITGVEIHAGPDAKPRHIADHAATVKAMKKYQGVAGKARALVDKFKSWLTGNPNAGPGTLAWETKKEVEKLAGIVEDRAKRLEDPNLTDAERRELEHELAAYEKQLADYEKQLKEITDEPGRGYVAARDPGETARKALEDKINEQRTKDGKDPIKVPDAPEGYHWTTRNGKPTLARNPNTSSDQPEREFDPNAAPDPNDPYAQFPVKQGPEAPKYRKDGKQIEARVTPSNRVQEQAIARQMVADAKAGARAEMDRVAERVGMDGDQLEKAEGAQKIADALDKARANMDPSDPESVQRVKDLEQLQQAQSDFKDAERWLSEESEKLGNAMAEDYMAANHKDYSQSYPAPGKPYERGKSGEFDYVYKSNGNPPAVMIVEAKGAGGALGSSNGYAQGTPEYVQDIARQMVSKDPANAEMWQAIADGDPSAPDVRYLHVQAPVDGNGSAMDGKVSEFDMSQLPSNKNKRNGRGR